MAGVQVEIIAKVSQRGILSGLVRKSMPMYHFVRRPLKQIF